MAQILQWRNRVPYQRTNTTMLGQPSCDISYHKSSSQMLNKAYQRQTSLYLGTVRGKGCRTISHCWRRKPSRSVHQVLASCQSGEIQVQNHIVIGTFSLVGVLKRNIVRCYSDLKPNRIVSDHCTVKTCANDIILTADW